MSTYFTTTRSILYTCVHLLYYSSQLRTNPAAFGLVFSLQVHGKHKVLSLYMCAHTYYYYMCPHMYALSYSSSAFQAHRKHKVLSLFVMCADIQAYMRVRVRERERE